MLVTMTIIPLCHTMFISCYENIFCKKNIYIIIHGYLVFLNIFQLL